MEKEMPKSMRKMFILALVASCAAFDAEAASRPFHVLQNFSNYGSPLELIVDKTGAVFGTTYGGGKRGGGAVFKLTGDGTEKVIYDFRSNSRPAYPIARLLRDQAGDLFGIASRIGWDNYGTAA